MPPIATLILLAKSKDAPDFEIMVEVGTPFYRDEHGDWACPCSLYPLPPQNKEAYGTNAFQALCMAISVIQHGLQTSIKDGGTLMTKDGVDFMLHDYSFGF